MNMRIPCLTPLFLYCFQSLNSNALIYQEISPLSFSVPNTSIC